MLLDSEMPPWQTLVMLMFVKRVWRCSQVLPGAIRKAMWVSWSCFVLLRAGEEPVMHYGEYGKLADWVKPSVKPGKAYIHLLYWDAEFLELQNSQIILSLCFPSQLAVVAVIVTSFARKQ